MNTEEIIQGMRNVARANQKMMVADPNGDHPVCKPKVIPRGAISDNKCERCGEIISRCKAVACSAIPPEQRWRIDWSKE